MKTIYKFLVLTFLTLIFSSGIASAETLQSVADAGIKFPNIKIQGSIGTEETKELPAKAPPLNVGTPSNLVTREELEASLKKLTDKDNELEGKVSGLGIAVDEQGRRLGSVEEKTKKLESSVASLRKKFNGFIQNGLDVLNKANSSRAATPAATAVAPVEQKCADGGAPLTPAAIRDILKVDLKNPKNPLLLGNNVGSKGKELIRQGCPFTEAQADFQSSSFKGSLTQMYRDFGGRVNVMVLSRQSGLLYSALGFPTGAAISSKAGEPEKLKQLAELQPSKQ